MCRKQLDPMVVGLGAGCWLSFSNQGLLKRGVWPILSREIRTFTDHGDGVRAKAPALAHLDVPRSMDGAVVLLEEK